MYGNPVPSQRLLEGVTTIRTRSTSGDELLMEAHRRDVSLRRYSLSQWKHWKFNGDFDGDLLMTTSNPILVNKHREMPAIICEQKKSEKVMPTEDAIVEANIRVFGSNIGSVVNRGTSRFDLIQKFPEGSKEREILEYRICCAQLISQDVIDSVKNIVPTPEKKSWYDKDAVKKLDVSDEERKFQMSICSYRKPYFFRYVYPAVNKTYTTFVSQTNRKALMLFRKDVSELKSTPPEELNEDEKIFLENYEIYNPVGEHPCVMNRIAWKVEEELDGYLSKHRSEYDFDYTIMKSGVHYSEKARSEISKLYKQYRANTEDFMKRYARIRISSEEANTQLSIMKEDFRRMCLERCSSEEALCDILLDICYKSEYSKGFVWELCSQQIVQNLLKNNNYKINVPVPDEDGDIEFRGRRYRIECVDYYEEEIA